MSIIYNLSLNTLKKIAEKLMIRGTNKIKNKSHLADLILRYSNLPMLKKIAKMSNIKGYSRLRKSHLIERLKRPFNEDDKYIQNVESLNFKNKWHNKKFDKKYSEYKKAEEIDDFMKYAQKEHNKYKKRTNKFNEKIKNYKRFVLTEKAFKRSIRTYKDSKVEKTRHRFSYVKYLNNIKKPLIYFLKKQLVKFKTMKIMLQLKYIMSKEGKKESPFYYTSENLTITAGVKFSDKIDDVLELMINTIDFTIELGSGWVFNWIENFTVTIIEFKPLRGGAYKKLPESLGGKGGHHPAIMNPKNLKDDLCFKYCYLAYVKGVKKNAERVYQYQKYFNEVNDKGLEYPIKRTDIPKFEKLNNCHINVYRYDDKNGVFPFYINETNPHNAINMLLIGDLEKGEKGHYVLIKDFNKLNFKANKMKAKKYVCNICTHVCSTEKIYKDHIIDCKQSKNGEAAKMELPFESKKRLKFVNYKNKIKHPYVIYADFECIVKKLEKNNDNKENSYTDKTHEHIPCGYGYYVVSLDPKYENKYYSYRGEDAHRKFVESILETEADLLERIKQNVPKNLTAKQEEEFKKATKCHVCNKDIGLIQKKKGNNYITVEDKEREHDYLTGVYRGPAHNKCNLNYYNKPEIPVFFHNLKGYDANFILQVASEYTKNID